MKRMGGAGAALGALMIAHGAGCQPYPTALIGPLDDKGEPLTAGGVALLFVVDDAEAYQSPYFTGGEGDGWDFAPAIRRLGERQARMTIGLAVDGATRMSTVVACGVDDTCPTGTICSTNREVFTPETASGCSECGCGNLTGEERVELGRSPGCTLFAACEARHFEGAECERFVYFPGRCPSSLAPCNAGCATNGVREECFWPDFEPQRWCVPQATCEQPLPVLVRLGTAGSAHLASEQLAGTRTGAYGTAWGNGLAAGVEHATEFARANPGVRTGVVYLRGGATQAEAPCSGWETMEGVIASARHEGVTTYVVTSNSGGNPSPERRVARIGGGEIQAAGCTDRECSGVDRALDVIVDTLRQAGSVER